MWTPPSSTPPTPPSTPPNAGSSTPWYAAPQLRNPPGPGGGPFGGGPSANRSTWNYRGRVNRGRIVRGGPRSPLSNIAWLMFGAVTVGTIYPIPAVICWVRARKYRAPTMLNPPARAWFIWAIVFTLLSAGVYVGIGFAASGSSDSGNSSTTAPYVPPTTKTVPFGTTVHLVAQVTGKDDQGNAPVSLAVSDLTPRPHSGVADVNATVRFQVCATTVRVDPLYAAVGVHLLTDTGGDLELADDWPLPSAFDRPLPPHNCLTGGLGYKVPANASVVSASYDGLAGENVVWTLRHAGASSGG